MSLAERLHDLSPAEHDATLSALWKEFARTEYREALSYIVTELLRDAESLLLVPHTPDHVRAHAAGQVAALRRLSLSINHAIDFKPDPAAYETPPSDTVQDTETLI